MLAKAKMLSIIKCKQMKVHDYFFFKKTKCYFPPPGLTYGTAIATFPDGAYRGHAAIYVGKDSVGIQVRL